MSRFVGELARFGVVGTIGALIYLVSTTALSQHAGLPLAIAAAVSFVLVVAINYVLHYFWTFKSMQSHLAAAPRFLGTAAGGLALNSGFLLLGSHLNLLSPTALLLSGICLVVAWNYLLSKFWVFMDRPPRSGGD